MKKAAAVVLCVALASCAQYRPLVDARGVDPHRYESDLAECQRYAETESVGGHAAAGTIVGALLGTALSLAAGSRYNHSASARVGAVAGAAGGLGSGAQTQVQIIQRCMQGRGYNVLR